MSPNDILARDFVRADVQAGHAQLRRVDRQLLRALLGEVHRLHPRRVHQRGGAIDHVVALSDAWPTGAQVWDLSKRTAFANDPLNLLAVDGPLNEAKGDCDAATWLPPNKAYRCASVARHVAVKVSYSLWMTQAEKDAIATILTACPTEPLPGNVVAHIPANTTTASAPAPVPAPVAAPAPAPRTTGAPAPAPAPKPAFAPAPAPTPAPAPAPTGSYRAGQFCKQVDEGKTTTASNGQPSSASTRTTTDTHTGWPYEASPLRGVTVANALRPGSVAAPVAVTRLPGSL